MNIKHRLSILALLVVSVSLGWMFEYSIGDKKTIKTNNPKVIQQQQELQEQKRMYREIIQNAPRRQPNDSIVVVFVNSNSKKQREGNLERFHQGLLDEFRNDPIYKVSSVDLPTNGVAYEHQLQRLIERAQAKGIYADVYVKATLGTEDVAGISRTTKKLASATYLKYTAQLSSGYDFHPWETSASGPILKNVAVVEELADNIRGAIRYRIAPDLPDREYVLNSTQSLRTRTIAEELGINPWDDQETRWEKIKKGIKPLSP